MERRVDQRRDPEMDTRDRERDRERERERVREDVAKERQAVREHFEASLRLAQNKRNSTTWVPVPVPALASAPVPVPVPVPVSHSNHSKTTSHSNPDPSPNHHPFHDLQQQLYHQQQQQQQQFHLQKQQQAGNKLMATVDLNYRKESGRGKDKSSRDTQASTLEKPIWMPQMPQPSLHDSVYLRDRLSLLPQFGVNAEPGPRQLSSIFDSHSAPGTGPGPGANPGPVPGPSLPHTHHNFSLYGYQPYQHGYITPVQLKEGHHHKSNNSQSNSAFPSTRAAVTQPLRVPPPAHGGNKRESPSPLFDRSLTPNSRNSTPHGRPASLSPITPLLKSVGLGRSSPLCQPVVNFKPYDMQSAPGERGGSAPPAHQSSSPSPSGRGTPNPISLPLTLPLQFPPVKSSASAIQEQPQNLVKSDVRKQFRVSASQGSPDFVAHMRANQTHVSSPRISTSPNVQYNGVHQGSASGPVYTQAMVGASVDSRRHLQNEPLPVHPLVLQRMTSSAPIVASTVAASISNNSRSEFEFYSQRVKGYNGSAVNVVRFPGSSEGTPRPPPPSHLGSHSKRPESELLNRRIFSHEAILASGHSHRILSNPYPRASASAPSPYGLQPGIPLPPPHAFHTSQNSNHGHSAPPAAHSRVQLQPQTVSDVKRKATRDGPELTPFHIQQYANANALLTTCEPSAKVLRRDTVSQQPPQLPGASKSSVVSSVFEERAPPPSSPISINIPLQPASSLTDAVESCKIKTEAGAEAGDADRVRVNNNSNLGMENTSKKVEPSPIPEDEPKNSTKEEETSPGASSSSLSSSCTNSPLVTGAIDTCAPSKSCVSQSGHSNTYKNLKKAWLQRHSGEDRSDYNKRCQMDIKPPPNEDTNQCSNEATTENGMGAFTNKNVLKTEDAPGPEKPSEGEGQVEKEKAKGVNGHSETGFALHPKGNEDDTSSASEIEPVDVKPKMKESNRVKRKRVSGVGSELKEKKTKKQKPNNDHVKGKGKGREGRNEDDNEDEKEDEEQNEEREQVKGSALKRNKKNKRVKKEVKEKGKEKKDEDGKRKGRGKEKEKEKDKDETEEEEEEELKPNLVSKRGRKPKNNGKRESKQKLTGLLSHKKKAKSRVSEKVSLAVLKRTGQPFLQDTSCCDVASSNPKLPKCRECRMTPNQRNKKMANIFCRFYAFRKLKYGKSGLIMSAGFSEPDDALEEDLKLWLPPDDACSDLDHETAKFLIANVGDQFCDLVKQEHEAQEIHLGDKDKVTWKRVVQGVREMCDVCETTLFNMHWVCEKCGFVVCIDCYKARQSNDSLANRQDEGRPSKDRDNFQWLLCTNKQAHDQSKLMMTQIIASTSLWDVGRSLHETRDKCTIAAACSCVKSEDKSPANGISPHLISAVKCFKEKDQQQLNGASEDHKCPKICTKANGGLALRQDSENSTITGYSSESGSSPLSWLADVALSRKVALCQQVKGSHSKANSVCSEENNGHKALNVKEEPEDAETETEEEKNFSTLRGLLIRPTAKNGKDHKKEPSNGGETEKQMEKKVEIDVASDVVSSENQNDAADQIELCYFTRKYMPLRCLNNENLPSRACTLENSSKLFPDTPHSWLCGGRLLVLKDCKSKGNIDIFQDQWKRRQPVLVTGVHKVISEKLWCPQEFSRMFGDTKNDLVNCKTGDVIPKHPMRKFWDGFQNVTKRIKDEDGDHMLLKLKDWPPGEDFSEMLPKHFDDLVDNLPLPEYTRRDGTLNLAGRLPDCFVKPDLGPKMYNAYGSALFPDKGTTNLHVDISDAVNMMMYVGVIRNGKNDEQAKASLEAIDEGGCDEVMRRRVREKGTTLGALWHIYEARDADKIRDLLNKVAQERGETLEPHHDPIHDQSWYLDSTLRKRLKEEYQVDGYAIGQCWGDAIFIPAGAPHQVRNLESCIKVAGDFVSPENVAQCFTLTHEFRQLSDTHDNHQDKLQIKNIIYHTVKDALSSLETALQ